MKIVFSHALGTYLYDEYLVLLEHEENNLNQSLRIVQELAAGEDPHHEKKAKKADARDPTKKEELAIRVMLATPENHQRIREIAMRMTKDKLKRDVTDDTLILTTVGNIEEVTKAAHTLAKKAREWHGFYFPEASRMIADHEGFVKATIAKGKAELMQELGIAESIGPDAKPKDEEALRTFLLAIANLYEEKKRLEAYLEGLMREHCPNITALAGASIGAKLLKEAGSLQRLASSTSTMVQMLGAEKALFRHLKNKKIPPPKHGHIINHPLLQKAKAVDKGKVARALADKITIAARVDYFKGEPVGERLRKELEEKWK